MERKADTGAFALLLEYERRSETFAPGSSQGTGGNGDWSGVIFRLGEARMACDIDRIQEILPCAQVTTVPGAKPWILGLANIRGALLTVIDLAGYLNGTRSQITNRSRLLSTTLRKAPIGLLTDEVFGQRHFSKEGASPAQIEDVSPLKSVVTKQHQVGNETWLELDLDQLFNAAEFLNGAAN